MMLKTWLRFSVLTIVAGKQTLPINQSRENFENYRRIVCMDFSTLILIIISQKKLGSIKQVRDALNAFKDHSFRAEND